MLDYMFVEECRGCWEFIVDQPDGPFCACKKCWREHCWTRPQLEHLTGSDQTLPMASGTTYTGILKKMIYGLKYDKDHPIARDLANLCFAAWELLSSEFPELNDANSRPLLVPIPLHWTRLLTRGYNQTELVCEELGPRIRCRMDAKLLSRRRSTKAQHGLSKEDRAANISSAFRANRWCASDRLQTLILVDDICTSGSTLLEAAATLRKHGFQRIFALTAARAPLQKPVLTGVDDDVNSL